MPVTRGLLCLCPLDGLRNLFLPGELVVVRYTLRRKLSESAAAREQSKALICCCPGDFGHYGSCGPAPLVTRKEPKSEAAAHLKSPGLKGPEGFASPAVSFCLILPLRLSVQSSLWERRHSLRPCQPNRSLQVSRPDAKQTFRTCTLACVGYRKTSGDDFRNMRAAREMFEGCLEPHCAGCFAALRLRSVAGASCAAGHLRARAEERNTHRERCSVCFLLLCGQTFTYVLFMHA